MTPDRPCTLTVLPNGLRVVETDVPGDLVYMEMIVGVGMDDETKATNGICHLLEHMHAAFTSDMWPSAAMNRKLFDDLGVASNAHTSSKTCAYHVQVHRRWAVLLASMFMRSMVHFRMDASILEEEANAVRRELVSRFVDSSWYDYETTTARLCYPRHVRSVSVRRQVQNVAALVARPLRLVEWRAHYYRPELLTLTLAGDPRSAEWPRIRALAMASGRSMPPRGPLARAPYEHRLRARVVDVVVDGVTSSRVRLIYELPGTLRDHTLRLCCEIWRRVLARGLSSRLYRLRYEDGGLVYSMQVGISLDQHQPQLSRLIVATACRPEHVCRVCDLVRTEMLYPPTSAELDKVRKMLEVEHAADVYDKRPETLGHAYGMCAHVHGTLFSRAELHAEITRLASPTNAAFARLCEFWSRRPPLVVCGHPPPAGAEAEPGRAAGGERAAARPACIPAPPARAW